MKAAPPVIELLETRIAPATLAFVNATTATYTDVDGDLVTVKFSKAILTAANLASVLVTAAVDATHDQLQKIDLLAAGLAKPADGTSITVSVVPKPGGDGFAHIGFIQATGLDLGAVTVRGDLGVIDAGDAKTKTPGLKSLTVQSFGVKGLSTGAPDLRSDIVGAVGKLTVKGSMDGAALDIAGGKDGKIGPVVIGNSLVGRGTDRSGSIHTSGDMGAVKIGVDLTGGLAHEAGALLSEGKIISVNIGHDLMGGGVASGIGAGLIRSGGDIGKVFVGGTLYGGIGDSSGSVISGGKLAEVSIVGSLQGGIVKIGAGTPRNGYLSSNGDMGKINIGRDLIGTFVPYAGTIESKGKIGAVTVGGDMQGGDDHSGTITSVGTIASVKIGGRLVGGTGPASGSILAGGDLKMVKIGGGLAGGTGNQSGMIRGDKLGMIVIGGRVTGGNSQGSFSFTDSGTIQGDTIASLTVGGLGGGSTGNQTLARVGYLSANVIKKLTILGDVAGGSISGSGSLTDSGVISADHIDKILITGSLMAGSKGSLSTGSLTRAGAILATHDIGAVVIRGDVSGSADTGKGAVPALISAVGQVKATKTKDVAIGSLTIGGDVSLAQVLAGYSPTLGPVNGGAQMGKVVVTGNWAESNLVAGVKNTASGHTSFGDGNDAAITTGSPAAIAKITSVSIGGIISGTVGEVDHFGFVSHQIGNFNIGGIKIPLAASPSTLGLGSTPDVSVHLI